MSRGDEERRDAIRSLVRQVEKTAEHREVLTENFLDALWETYFVTRKPEDLAIYIEAGGEFDKITRRAVLRALRGEDKPPHGSSDIMDDIEFYTRVRGEQASDALARAFAEKTARETGKASKRERKKSLEVIFDEVASDYDLTARGAKDKYDRGRKAARDRLGISQS